MEGTSRIRCDSLDARSRRDEEEINPVDAMTFEPVGLDLAGNADPSPAELAQCEAEMGTLLSIITELNRKMGALKAPSESEDPKPPQQTSLLAPQLLSRGSVHCCPENRTAPGTTSKPLTTNRGGGGELWSELQEVLSAVEASINCRRTWAVPTTASDQEKQANHLTAARDSWVQATQVLEEMEREFGISYPSGLPAEERQKYQRDVLALHQQNCTLRSSLQSRQEELEGTQGAISQIEEDRSKLQEKLVGLHKAWSSGSLSPPYSPSGSSSGGAMSPTWASPPFPGSPLLLRRHTGAFPSLSPSGDVSPSASPSSGVASLGSPSRSPSPLVSLESEMERLQRCIERLKARNERLTAALERRKGESEQVSMTLSRLEADSSALQMALRYCEECEDTYSELLSLYEGRRQGRIPPQRDQAGALKGPISNSLPGSPRPHPRNLINEELSTSFSTAGGAVEKEPQTCTSQRGSDSTDQEMDLRQKIDLLKQERAAVCLPKPGPGGEGKLSPDTGTLAGPRGGQKGRDDGNPGNATTEKAALLYELVSVREEMSELRGLIRLTGKERKCLDWSLMAQKAQDAAGALIAESLQEDLDDRRAEQQRLAQNVAGLASEGGIPGPRNRTLLRELQAVLQREQVLKRKVCVVRDSLDVALSDGASRRRDSEEQRAWLAQAHSKAVGSYRNARKKYREQLWRLEQKMVAMSERHQSQIGALKATLEALEWKREETVL